MPKTLVALLAALALAPATASAGSWRNAGPISTPGMASTILTFGVDDSGVFTTMFYDLGDNDDLSGPLQERDRAPGGRLVRGPAFDSPSFPDLAVAPDGERIALDVSRVQETTEVRVRTRPRGGDWSDPQVLASGPGFVSLYDYKVRVSRNGEAVATWVEGQASGSNVLYAAARPAGATSFGQPQRISDGDIAFPALEIDDRGNAVLAWMAPEAGEARVARRPAGGEFAAPESLKTPDRPVVATSLSTLDVSRGGQVVLTWATGKQGRPDPDGASAAVGTTTGGLGEPRRLTDDTNDVGGRTDDDLAAVTWVENPGSRGRAKALLVPAGKPAASVRTRTLSGAKVPYGGGEVAVGHGRATFAWIRRLGGPLRLQARTATADGKLTPTQTLSPLSETTGDVVVRTSSRGEPWIAWLGITRPKDTYVRLRAARAGTRTGRFGRSQVISNGEGGIDGLELIPSANGSMLSAFRRTSAWYLRAYGDRP